MKTSAIIMDADQERDLMPLPVGFPIYPVDHNVALIRDGKRKYVTITYNESIVPFGMTDIDLSSGTTIASKLTGVIGYEASCNARDFGKLFEVQDGQLECWTVALESDVPIYCQTYIPGSKKKFGSFKRPDARWNSDVSGKRKPTLMFSIVKDLIPAFEFVNPKRATATMTPALVKLWLAGKRYEFEPIPVTDEYFSKDGNGKLAIPKFNYARLCLDTTAVASSGPRAGSS